MRSRRVTTLVLVLALLACAALAMRWLQARSECDRLAAELAAHDRPAPSEAAADAPPSAPVATPVSDDPDLEDRKALLADARAIPELARREACLLAVRRLKARHESMPPPPRALPPPLGTRFGPLFTELLGEPEYLALVREDWEISLATTKIARLRKLGISDELQRQITDIEFDQYLANAEMGNYVTPEERQAAMQERRRIQNENLERMRLLLGEEPLKQYVNQPAPPGAGPADSARREATASLIRAQVSTGPLATRLSYSSSPLTDGDKERLQALIVSMATPRTNIVQIWYDVEFFKQAQSILNPAQLDALRQIQEEKEAWRLRAQLPKSSELPRTTRRARLEGGP